MDKSKHDFPISAHFIDNVHFLLRCTPDLHAHDQSIVPGQAVQRYQQSNYTRGNYILLGRA